MSKSEIRRIEISVRAEIEAELREQIAREIELHICEMPHSTKELENICHWERDGFIYAAKIARGK